MQCLAQRTARLLVAQLRPEEREEGITANGARRCQGEVGEQRHSLRLDAAGRGVGGVLSDEANAAEGEKLAHDRATVSGGARPGNSGDPRQRPAVTPLSSVSGSPQVLPTAGESIKDPDRARICVLLVRRDKPAWSCE